MALLGKLSVAQSFEYLGKVNRAKNGPVEPKMARLFLFLFNDLCWRGPRMARNTGEKINFCSFAFLVVRSKRHAPSLMR